MLGELRELFAARFGRAPRHAARAPGRINLIGEHTDYNEGLVLPLAIERATWLASAPRDDARIRIWSRERDELCDGDAAAPSWAAYPLAVVATLRERGVSVPGLDLVIASELAAEAGLSSSAALTVGVATLLDAALGLGLGARERARVAHRAESEFVGVGCGVMDPLASALGQAGHALRIDCRTLAVEPVPLPMEPTGRLALRVADSGVRRKLSPEAGAGYAERRAQCRAALDAALAAGIGPPGACALRDLAVSDLPALERELPPLLLRRARHVIRENERVDAACAALARGDAPALGALLRAGMASLRDDFEVSAPELDVLCELADAQPGVWGSRLTGAGFGGCTLHALAPEAADDAMRALADGFEARFGRRPRVFAVAPGPGASALDVATGRERS